MNTWQIILAVCTVLGGLSATVYFWDKIFAFVRRKLGLDSRASPGGAAVRAGRNAKIEIDNGATGEMRGGRSGTSGAGDAIVVEDGAGIKIINHGRIIGGDASQGDRD